MKLDGVSRMAVAFEKSPNKISQQEQRDVLVRFWDPADANVKTRYLTSCAILPQKI